MRRPKGELLRFARGVDGAVVFDAAQRAPGRGGYSCPEPACLDRALRRGGLGRTVRAVIDPEAATRLAAEAVEYVREQGSVGLTRCGELSDPGRRT